MGDLQAVADISVWMPPSATALLVLIVLVWVWKIDNRLGAMTKQFGEITKQFATITKKFDNLAHRIGRALPEFQAGDD